MEYQEGEKEALEVLAQSPDPMVRVLYHMSMRQLATVEKLADIENELILLSGAQRRLVDHLDKRNGATPLAAVVYGGGG